MIIKYNCNSTTCFLGALRQAFTGSKIFNLLYVTNGNIALANSMLLILEKELQEELPDIGVDGEYFSRSGKRYKINITDRTIEVPEDSSLFSYFNSQDFQRCHQ